MFKANELFQMNNGFELFIFLMVLGKHVNSAALWNLGFYSGVMQ